MGNNVFTKLMKNIPSLEKSKNEKGDPNGVDYDKATTIKNVAVSGGVSEIARNHAQKAAETFAKPDKYNRSIIDDGIAKKNIKLEAFNSKTAPTDPYTGENLTLTRQQAKMLYGDDWASHLAEADHNISLQKRYESTKNNPWLSNDDIKASSNSVDNLEVVSRKFNNAKRGRSNSEFVKDDAYLEKTGVKLSEEAKMKAIESEKLAAKRLHAKDLKDSVKNIAKTGHAAGLEAAKSGALIGGGISAVRNVVAIVNGEKTAEEGIIDVAKDTAGAAVLGYGTGAVGATLAQSFSNSSNQVLQSLSKTNLPSQIVVAALETGKTMKRFICGEIDGTECMVELGEKGTGIMTASYGAFAGQVLIPIPVVGGLVGSMIGYAFASSYYGELLSIMQGRKHAREELERIEAECAEVLLALKDYRKEIEEIAKQYFEEHLEVFNNALLTISEAYRTGDVDGVIAGSNMITKKLGGTIQYNNMKEFDTFMNNENEDFIL